MKIEIKNKKKYVLSILINETRGENVFTFIQTNLFHTDIYYSNYLIIIKRKMLINSSSKTLRLHPRDR